MTAKRYVALSEKGVQSNMAKKTKDKNDYSEAAILRNRTFPKTSAIIITIAVIAQIVCVFFIAFYEPTPQDIIENYEITVKPYIDGTLDIEYSFVWTALDKTEDLTWVKIGTANNEFTIYKDSCSDNIASIDKYSDEYGDSYVRADFNRAYKGGETLEFSFKIHQKSMLCQENGKYFFDFIPGWFNSTPVKNYKFRWPDTYVASSNHNAVEGKYYVWSGKMDCGRYVEMRVNYPGNLFKDSKTQAFEYMPFDSSGVTDELAESKVSSNFICIVIIVIAFVFEIINLDCFVSYDRGRGFLRGYGHRMHVYGRVNPRYTTARNAAQASKGSRGGFHGGGGCACACACACAGGGRAGCSQKDTYSGKK